MVLLLLLGVVRVRVTVLVRPFTVGVRLGVFRLLLALFVCSNDTPKERHKNVSTHSPRKNLLQREKKNRTLSLVLSPLDPDRPLLARRVDARLGRIVPHAVLARALAGALLAGLFEGWQGGAVC